MMSKYVITKTLNNNVIICTKNHQEVVLIGKGIGFNKKGWYDSSRECFNRKNL